MKPAPMRYLKISDICRTPKKIRLTERQGLINFTPIYSDTMGRVRQTYVKRLARDLVNADEEKFSEDFDENKEELKETEEFNSKRLRNRVAGYIVRVKQNKEL